MTMTIEKNLRDFHFWGGAASNAAKLTPDELDTLDNMLEETLDREKNDPYSVSDINDFFWFDFESVCNWLNLDYEEVMARD